MSAYVIVTHDIQDPERYRAEYGLQANETIRRYGGTMIVQGGRAEQVEGDAFSPRIFVARFPTFEAAQRWYHSPDYQSLVSVRQAFATGSVVIVEGVEAG